MAAKYQFPELFDLPDSEPSSSPPDAEFSPLWAPGARRAPVEGAGEDSWQPMHRPAGEASQRPGAAGTPGNRANPAGPEVSQTPRSTEAQAAEPALETPFRPAPPPEAPRAEVKPDPRELERIKAQARQEGYQEGFARGDAEGKAAWEERNERVLALLLSMGEARETLFLRVREDLVKIMSIVPRKILRQALKIDPRAIVALVSSVLEELPRQDRVVVKVSPEDLSLLEEALPDLRRRLGGYTNVELESSAQVAGGGAIVVIDGGRIEATIERQLETFELRAREWLLGGEAAVLEPAAMPSPYANLKRAGTT